MHTIKFILNHAKPYKWYIFGVFLLTCIETSAETFKPYLIKLLIDAVSDTKTHNLWSIGISYVLLQLIVVIAINLHDYCLIKYVAKFRTDIAKHFMKNLYDHPYSFFQNQLSGSINARVNDAFQMIYTIIFNIFNKFVHFLILIITTIFLLKDVGLIYIFGLIIWVIYYAFSTIYSFEKFLLLSKSFSEEKSKLLGIVSDYLTNIYSVKIFTSRNFELARFDQSKEKFVKASQNQVSCFRWVYTIQGIVTTIYTLGFISCLILSYQKSEITPGDFALVMMVNIHVMNNIYDLSFTLRDFISNWGAVEQAISILRDEPETNVDDAELKVTHGNITFASVGFHYKNTTALFDNLSVNILSGQKVGLVGYSGSGKSTFVNLILRLYEVSAGSIIIDGQNISQCTPDSVRASIGMIPQEPSLFHRTLMENIRYGRSSATDAEVITAAKLAHAHEFIIKLPNGYGSLVGERGVKLSGGQRQRIAIARAILKNAPILILDEATSALDSVIETDIQQSLEQLMQNKTTLVIAHRLSTLLNMDRILVFSEGKIVEDGSHAELLGQNGLYKKLWSAQVGGFLPDKAK